MTLTFDTIALVVIFAVAIFRLNESKNMDIVRVIMWALLAAGTFGLGCDQLSRTRVAGPDLWSVMMHTGIAGLVVVRFVSHGIRDRRLAPECDHDPERRMTW